MQKIFIIIFCFISFSVFAETLYMVPENFRNTDFRNKLWYYGTNSVGTIYEFLFEFGYFHTERTIANDRFDRLQEPYLTICTNLLNCIFQSKSTICPAKQSHLSIKKEPGLRGREPSTKTQFLEKFT